MTPGPSMYSSILPKLFDEDHLPGVERRDDDREPDARPDLGDLHAQLRTAADIRQRGDTGDRARKRSACAGHRAVQEKDRERRWIQRDAQVSQDLHDRTNEHEPLPTERIRQLPHQRINEKLEQPHAR